MLPQRWEEVTPTQAKKLMETQPEDIRERLTILGRVPGKEHIELDPNVVLSLYEIISFIEQVPELVPETLSIGDTLDWVQNDWTFAEFENARRLLVKHKRQPSIALYGLAEIKDLQKNYIEAGVKALEGIGRFIDQFAGFGIYDQKEPTAEEEASGVERLQAFGVYSILEQIAAKYGVLPKDIEKEPVGWVMVEYTHSFVKQDVANNMRKFAESKAK